MNLEYMFNSGFTSIEYGSTHTNLLQRGRKQDNPMVSPNKLSYKLNNVNDNRLFTPNQEQFLYPYSDISSSKETQALREQIRSIA